MRLGFSNHFVCLNNLVYLFALVSLFAPSFKTLHVLFLLILPLYFIRASDICSFIHFVSSLVANSVG